MPIEKLPSGTHGARTPPSFVGKLMPVLMWFHRRRHDRLFGMDLLYLTTIGAKSGQERATPLVRVDDGRGGWYVIASNGGAARHPGWYHNVAAHPDQVWVEVGGRKRPVTAEQLSPEARAEVWRDRISGMGGFDGYETKTDRTIPVLRLTPKDAS
jgi:deazaflavin-dependent oxidoreductase (nitroreductase family)